VFAVNTSFSELIQNFWSSFLSCSPKGWLGIMSGQSEMHFRDTTSSIDWDTISNRASGEAGGI
jgi:hypothetical protein